MDPDDDVRVLFSQVTDGPPMRLDASDVIARGGRVRRRRKRWAVAGSSAATMAVLVVAGLAVGHHAGPATPVEPARPGLSTVAPAPSPPSSPGVVPPAKGETGPSSPPVAATSRQRPGTVTVPRAPRSTPTPGAPRPPSTTLQPGTSTGAPGAMPTTTSR